MNKEELAYYQMEGRHEEFVTDDHNCYSDTYDDVDNFETDPQG